MEGIGRDFEVDRWERGVDGSGGYGITRVLQSADVVGLPQKDALFEKAAANVSVVRGTLTPERAKAMSSRGRGNVDIEGGQEYSAAAMSLVFHPASPRVPTLRADVRLFEVGGSVWYGGGCDLTPAYLEEEDAREFHGFWKGVCDKYDPALYPRYKAWCDDYFYIPARGEHRGVGGVFFDDLAPEDVGFDAGAFVRDVGDGILPSWEKIVARRRGEDYGEAERRWQCLRRGRYLEFNLLYDRGVRFGLDGGRVESIMVSAPPLIAWQYDAVPDEGTPEARTLEVLKSPREWV
mmetsp:Transcript_35986/g.113844  ORF Transcript_35986/g.113844 Transcript_35986/m.113844 type:complete len:292 (-) Transcript_35986:908-1783(-)